MLICLVDFFLGADDFLEEDEADDEVVVEDFELESSAMFFWSLKITRFRFSFQKTKTICDHVPRMT